MGKTVQSFATTDKRSVNKWIRGMLRHEDDCKLEVRGSTLQRWVRRLRTDDTPPPFAKVDFETLRASLESVTDGDDSTYNLEIMHNAAKIHFFPKMRLRFPNDFTKIYLKSATTGEVIPIWKYVLSINQACGLLRNV